MKMQTNSDRNVFSAIIARLREQFKGEDYHVVNKNCNDFSRALVVALLGSNPEEVDLKPFDWINRPASIGGFFTGANRRNSGSEKTSSTNDKSASSSSKESTDKSYTQKKELTPAQKALLDKMKKK